MHKENRKKIIQTAIVLALLGLVSFHACRTQTMRKSLAEYMQNEILPEDVMVENPRVNYVENPVGVDGDDIFFSWEPQTKQTAYALQVSRDGKIVWNSDVVRSKETILISYQGPELEEGVRYEYRIFVCDDKKKWHGSEPAYFETAVNNGEVFKGAELICMQPEENVYGDGQPVFYKTFYADKKGLKRAVFYGSALGIYDAYLNGQRIGEDELKPGWTDYNDTLLYNTYDITAYIEDTNTIASMVGTGWWCGRNAFGTYGYHQPAFICRIVLEYEDGTKQTIETGEDWKYTKNTAVRFADLFNGETFDFSKQTTAQISAGEKVLENDEKQVEISSDFKGDFKAYYGYNVKRLGFFSPESAYVYKEVKQDVTDFGHVVIDRSYMKEKDEMLFSFPFELKKGETLIVDLYQNMTGFAQLEYTAPAGTQIAIQFAEMLNDSGEKERGNDGPKGTLYRANYRSATTEVNIKSAGGERELYASTFFYTGFRYLSVTADRDITLYDLEGRIVSNSSPITGFLLADHEAAALWSNTLYSQLNNFMLVATDCPQRDERLGWMGDIGSFAGTSMYNQDLYSFYEKWMADVRDAQTSEGAYTDTVPSVITTGSGNAGWADAGILIPLEVYKRYGDLELLRKHYPSMKQYMGYLSSISSYKPEDKRMGALTTYGDWLSTQLSDSNLLSALWYQADALAMEEMARLLGETKDAREYKRLHEKINAYVMETYEYKMPWNRNGSVKEKEQMEYPLSQTEMLFLLKYSDLTKKQEQLLVADLKADIEACEYKVMTGFAGTPILLPVLTKYGMSDVAYKILSCEENPSWLYSVKQGATTIWERFDSYTKESGFADAAMNSFNHFNEGSVMQWMYESMLGIRVDLTGEEPIIIQPQIPQDDIEISIVRGSYDSVYGEISLDWKKQDDGQICIHLTVPENASARVKLPLEGMEDMVIEGGTYEWKGKHKLLE